MRTSWRKSRYISGDFVSVANGPDLGIAMFVTPVLVAVTIIRYLDYGIVGNGVDLLDGISPNSR
jgi:hypothetical protein